MHNTSFVDLALGKVVGTKKRRPVRLSPSQLTELTARAAEIRSLIKHAKAVGFAFDEDDSPECELARIKERLAEHRHKGMIVEEVRDVVPVNRAWRSVREWFNPLLRFDRLKWPSNLYARNVYGDVPAEFPFAFLREAGSACNRALFVAWNTLAKHPNGPTFADDDEPVIRDVSGLIQTHTRPYSIIELVYMQLTDWLPI